MFHTRILIDTTYFRIKNFHKTHNVKNPYLWIYETYDSLRQNCLNRKEFEIQAIGSGNKSLFYNKIDTEDMKTICKNVQKKIEENFLYYNEKLNIKNFNIRWNFNHIKIKVPSYGDKQAKGLLSLLFTISIYTGLSSPEDSPKFIDILYPIDYDNWHVKK